MLPPSDNTSATTAQDIVTDQRQFEVLSKGIKPVYNFSTSDRTFSKFTTWGY